MAVILVMAVLSAVEVSAAQLVKDGKFDEEPTGWWSTANLQVTQDRGKLCATVPGGTVNPWDAIVGINELPLTKGQSYTFGFAYQGDPEGPVRALVQMPSAPYTSYVELTQPAALGQKIAARTFVAPVDQPHGQIVFQLGGSRAAWRVCLDNVSLKGGGTDQVATYLPETGSRIRVNQLGYLPDGPKRSTLVTDRSGPLAFTVVDALGQIVFSGSSEPHGVDPSAGFAVHVLDFSSLAATGSGFSVTADGEASLPFSIKPGLYASLRNDALSFFYPMRSGIAIEEAIAGRGYGRPAGHLGRPEDGGANQGDLNVPCQSAAASSTIYGTPWTCEYKRNVSGGWYDAGDHGKYVVNGGIAVGQILAAYERQVRLKKGGLGDGSLSIPEAGNGVPDALDEARWELEWMLKMVVPEGDPLAGMVHHKIHDDMWTGIPLLPNEDTKVRELHRPSTAATLNLVAVAAEGARLFRPNDTAFADELLVNATKSYLAAKTNPALFAPASDGNSGGGAYDDRDVSDEFYWAAAELFISTGDSTYLTDLRSSRHWSGAVFEPEGFSWGSVGGFARLQLAAHFDQLPKGDADAVVDSVLRGADMLLALQASEPFGQSYSPRSGRYEWGSNSSLLNNALVLAAAYDLSSDRKYRSGALEAIDYVLGRNALNQSYVTGYGARFSHRQHSRWFANAANADYPTPPMGSLAGGANSSIQDPIAKGLFGDSGCAAQLCYVDDIGAWSVNEVAINWNAALGQMASWLADQ